MVRQKLKGLAGNKYDKNYFINYFKAVTLALLALAFSCVFAIGDECNPDGNGQPACSSANVGIPSRNFWDPTAYWLCTAAGAEAELKRCPSSSLYNSATQSCIPASQWVWTPPCPQ